ncbi:MAG: hypothetical protein WA082_02675 [Candidatus Moraniibacteriota bacterium]
MLKTIFALFVALCLGLVACGGGDDQESMPFRNAEQVRVAFATSQRVLPERGEQVGPYPKEMLDPFVVEYRGMTSAGVPVVLTLRNVYRLVPTSNVSIEGSLPSQLQSIPARVDGQDYSAPVLDIREYEGWLILYASLRAIAPMDWRVERWVMYHPETKQFIDCGETGSIRPPSWGPAVSDLCVQR